MVHTIWVIVYAVCSFFLGMIVNQFLNRTNPVEYEESDGEQCIQKFLKECDKKHADSCEKKR